MKSIIYAKRLYARAKRRPLPVLLGLVVGLAIPHVPGLLAYVRFDTSIDLLPALAATGSFLSALAGTVCARMKATHDLEQRLAVEQERWRMLEMQVKQ